MNVWDVLILLAVGAMLLLAVRALRGGRSGSCHGGSCHDGGGKAAGCSGCMGCPGCTECAEDTAGLPRREGERNESKRIS